MAEPYQRTDPSTGKKTDVMPKQGAVFYDNNATELLRMYKEAIDKFFFKK